MVLHKEVPYLGGIEVHHREGGVSGADEVQTRTIMLHDRDTLDLPLPHDVAVDRFPILAHLRGRLHGGEVPQRAVHPDVEEDHQVTVVTPAGVEVVLGQEAGLPVEIDMQEVDVKGSFVVTTKSVHKSVEFP